LCGNRVSETISLHLEPLHYPSKRDEGFICRTDYLNKKKMANNNIPKKITVSLKKNNGRPGIKKMASKYNPPRFYSYRIQIDLVF